MSRRLALTAFASASVVLATAVASVLALTACVPSPRRGAHTYPGQRGLQQGAYAGGSVEPQVSEEPSKALEEVDQHLQSRGYEQKDPAVHNENMPEKGVVAYAIQAQRGFCYTVVGIGERDDDLNLFVIDPAGRTVSYNVMPDAYPYVSFCPTQTGRYTARLQMNSGSGEYYYAVYQGPPSSDPKLAQLFGGGAGAAVETAELDAETSERLQDLDEDLRDDGYVRTDDPRGVVLGGQGVKERSFPANLQAGVCYAFASLGGPGAPDTDVMVVDGSGTELARDVENTRDGLVKYCAEQSGQYKVKTRLYEGRGPVFVAGYTKTRGGSAPQQSEPLIERTSVATAGLEENFRLLDADMQARGYRSFGDTSRGHLAQGQSRDFAIELEGGKCYAVLGVGDDGVRDLDLTLYDPSGQQIDRDIEQDARPIVRTCPDRSGQFRMQVTMYEGEGDFVYAPYRWPRGTRGPFGLSGLIYVRLAEVTALLGNEGFTPDPSFSPEKGEIPREGQTKRHTLELQAGHCYSVLVVGGEGLHDIDVKLTRGATELANDGTRNAFPNVRHCVDQTGPYRVAIRAKTGEGTYFMQVFNRAE